MQQVCVNAGYNRYLVVWGYQVCSHAGYSRDLECKVQQVPPHSKVGQIDCANTATPNRRRHVRPRRSVITQGARLASVGPLFIRSPYGLAAFRLGIWTSPFLVEDTHPQKPVLSCRAPKGVWRRLGVKALLVFANILTLLYPPPPLYKLRPCPSYSRRRDRTNLGRNFNLVPNVVLPHKIWVW